MKQPWTTVVSERANLEQTTIGRTVQGEYGKEFTLDEDGNEVRKPKLVRGRGRPKADAYEPKFEFCDELQAISIAWSRPEIPQ